MKALVAIWFHVARNSHFELWERLIGIGTLEGSAWEEDTVAFGNP